MDNIQVKLVDFEEKSVQEIEQKLLEEHEQKMAEVAEPVVETPASEPVIGPLRPRAFTAPPTVLEKLSLERLRGSICTPKK